MVDFGRKWLTFHDIEMFKRLALCDVQLFVESREEMLIKWMRRVAFFSLLLVMSTIELKTDLNIEIDLSHIAFAIISSSKTRGSPSMRDQRAFIALDRR